MSSAPKVPTLEKTGILVGRMVLSRSGYEYLVIAPEDDVDAYTTTPPAGVLSDMITINRKGIAKFLPALYRVRFRFRIQPTPSGTIYKAVVTGYEKVPVTPATAEQDLKKVDEETEYHEFEEPPEINEEFLATLSKSSGGSAFPKRFYSTMIVTELEQDGQKQPVILNMVEAFLWLQDNPGKLKGVALMKRYKLAVLVADSVTRDELVDDIVERVSLSVQAFHNMYNRVPAVTGGEQEE